MVLDPDRGEGQEPPSLAIPEIRDYQKINAELIGLLDEGHPLVRLEGAEGQRLLVSRLAGRWKATVEVIGSTGPEFAAKLDAPNLIVVARGSTADGAGSGLISGSVLVMGDAGDAAGYAQSGGILVIAGSVGNRAGLAQSGGTLAILDRAGRLLADRQSGGRIFVDPNRVGLHPRRGSRGGRWVEIPFREGSDPVEAGAWREVVELVNPWVDSSRRLS